jgi:hypothetical protein
MNQDQSRQTENETIVKYYSQQYGTLKTTAFDVHREPDRWVGVLVVNGMPHQIESVWGEIYKIKEN